MVEVRALLAGLLLCLLPARVTAEVIIGPHLQDLRTDGVTLIWAQDDVSPATLIVDGVERSVESEDQVREVRLTGLDAGSTHRYVVRVGSDELAGTFTTAAATPTARFRFAITGDTRTMHAPHEKVVRAMVDDGPFAFTIHTGDMVQEGGDFSQWRRFFEIEAPLVRNTPWFPVIGNHELDGRDLALHYYRLLAPPRQSSATEAYYSFTFGNTAFVVLDGYVNVVGRRPPRWWSDFNDEQQAWLEWVLEIYREDTTIEHVFVVTHRPPYSSMARRRGCHALRLLQPLFISKGVEAIVAGHDHTLERGASPSGLRYFVVGSGGAPLYKNKSIGRLGPQPAEAHPWLDDARHVHFAAKRRGYMVVTIDGPTVDVELKGIRRQRLDHLRWRTPRR